MMGLAVPGNAALGIGRSRSCPEQENSGRSSQHGSHLDTPIQYGQRWLCGWEIVHPSYLMSHAGKEWILGEATLRAGAMAPHSKLQ